MAAKKKKPLEKKKPSTKALTSRSLDWARGSGIKTDSPKKRAKAAATSAEHPLFEKTRIAVLAAFRDCYPGDESDEEILEIDPNDFDVDPSMFYEFVEERFGVPQDPSNQYFGGYGGPVRDLISFLTTRWDGKLRRVEHG